MYTNPLAPLGGVKSYGSSNAQPRISFSCGFFSKIKPPLGTTSSVETSSALVYITYVKVMKNSTDSPS